MNKDLNHLFLFVGEWKVIRRAIHRFPFFLPYWCLYHIVYLRLQKQTVPFPLILLKYTEGVTNKQKTRPLREGTVKKAGPHHPRLIIRQCTCETRSFVR